MRSANVLNSSSGGSVEDSRLKVQRNGQKKLFPPQCRLPRRFYFIFMGSKHLPQTLPRSSVAKGFNFPSISFHSLKHRPLLIRVAVVQDSLRERRGSEEKAKKNLFPSIHHEYMAWTYCNIMMSCWCAHIIGRRMRKLLSGPFRFIDFDCTRPTQLSCVITSFLPIVWILNTFRDSTFFFSSWLSCFSPETFAKVCFFWRFRN